MYAPETTWATAVTPTTNIGSNSTFTPRNRWEVLEVQGLGDGREVQNYVKTGYRCGGTLVTDLHDFTFLRHAIGPLSGAGTSGSPYVITEADHTGVTAATQIIPFTLEVGSEASNDDVDTYDGCFINSFTLDFALGRPVQLTADIVAHKPTSSTSATSYTAPTTFPLIMTSASLKWGQTPSAVTGIRTAQITYNNNLIIYGDWGTVFISQPETGKRSIAWSATFVMKQSIATTLRDDFYGQANSPIDTAGNAEFESNNEFHIVFDEGSSTGNRDATIALDQCIIDSIQKPINIGTQDLVLVTFVGRAKTSKSNQFVTWYTN